MVILLFCSCSKENDQSTLLQENFSKKSSVLIEPAYFLVNNNNPYDKYGLNICSFYNDLAVLLGDESYYDSSKFKDAFDILVEKHSIDFYPQVDTIEYCEDLENKIINSFLEEVTFKNIKELSLSVENGVFENSALSSFQKERLLSLVSMMKFCYYYQIEIAIFYATFEDEVDDCMRSRLGQIFANDGNPWPEIEFIVGCPESYCWLLVTCVHEALTSNK